MYILTASAQHVRAQCIRWYVVSLLIIFLALTFLPLTWFPSFYDTRYMGLLSLLGIIIVYWVHWAFEVPTTTQNAHAKNNAVHCAQWLLALYIFSGVLGDLGLYQLYRVGFSYDKVLHVVVPFVTMVFVPRLLAVRFDIAYRRALYMVLFGLIVIGVAWEIYEVLADWLFATHLSGIYRTEISWDTTMDMVCDVLGTLVGLPIAWQWRREAL